MYIVYQKIIIHFLICINKMGQSISYIFDQTITKLLYFYV